MLKITLTKSTISETPRNRATVLALGLKKTGRSVMQEDNPVIQGMIHHVKHLLKVEVVDDQPIRRKRQGKKVAMGAAAAPAKKAAKAESTESADKEAKPKATPKKTTTKKKDS